MALNSYYDDEDTGKRKHQKNPFRSVKLRGEFENKIEGAS